MKIKLWVIKKNGKGSINLAVYTPEQGIIRGACPLLAEMYGKEEEVYLNPSIAYAHKGGVIEGFFSSRK